MNRACLGAFVSLLAQQSLAADMDLRWLAGHWCSSDRASEEYWLAPAGGLMLGIGRSVGRARTSFEFMRIEIDGEEARFIAQPDGAAPTTFALASSGTNEVTFANPQHDFPKRVHYRRRGDELYARVDGGAEATEALEFRWQPCGTKQ
jgi:hypothetical protein